MRRRSRIAAPLLGVLAAAGIALGVRGEDILCPPAAPAFKVDGSAKKWSTYPASSPAGSGVSLKAAWTPENLFVLVQIRDPLRAFIILRQGLEVSVATGESEDRKCMVRYAGSEALAKDIETNHNPFPKRAARKEAPALSAPPTPPPGMPVGAPQGAATGAPPGAPPPAKPAEAPDIASVFKKVMDPGLLFVTRGGQQVLQRECSGDGPCAASSYEEPSFNYEFAIPWPGGDAAAPASGGGVKAVLVELEIPGLKQEQEVRTELAPSQAMAGGRGGGPPGGGMGGGPPGGGGGRPGGTGGMGAGPPGGGMGAPGQGFHPEMTYSVSKMSYRFSYTLSSAPQVTPPAASLTSTSAGHPETTVKSTDSK